MSFPRIHRTSLLIVASGIAIATVANPLYFHGNDASCGNPTGWLTVEVAFGTPPYTYLWSNASTNDTITDLYGGWYTVTVTDALSQVEVDSAEVINTAELLIPSVWSFNNPAAQGACPGVCDGRVVIYTQSFNGLAPYSILFDQGYPQVDAEPLYGDPVFGGLCSGTNSGNYTVTDAYGCSGTGIGFDIVGAVGGTLQVGNINGACAGGANGSVLFTNTGDPGFQVFVTQLTVLDDQQNIVADQTATEPTLVQGLTAGDYTVRVGWETSAGILPCTEDHPFTIPDLGPDCGSISGALFVDHNADCTQEPGDIGIPYHVMEITPGPEYTITDGGGHYSRNLVFGSFTLDQQAGTDLLQLCPGTSPIPFDISVGTSAVLQDIADSSLVPLEVLAWLSGSHARPGFQMRYHGAVRNLSAQLSGALEVTFTYDPLLTYVSADPPPANVTATTVSWSLPGFGSYGGQEFNIYLQVPPDAGLIGYDLIASLEALQPFPESNDANNTDGDLTTITGGFDPNDKTARTSSGQSDTQYLIDQDEWIDYTIRFQNTGNDTAFSIVVTDTLDFGLDQSTFEQGPASHPFTPSFGMGRMVEWRFDDILLPDSGTNEAASHGQVSFRIKPVAPLLPGTMISNNADIFFDFNEPVRTNDAALVAEFSTGLERAKEQDALIVFPNPAQDILHIAGLAKWAAALRVDIRGYDGRVCRSAINGHHDIDISGLRAGAYALVLHLTDGQRIIRSFIKY